MEENVCVLYVYSIDGYPKSDSGSPHEIDPYPGAPKAPTPGSGADGKSIFNPNPDLALP